MKLTKNVCINEAPIPHFPSFLIRSGQLNPRDNSDPQNFININLKNKFHEGIGCINAPAGKFWFVYSKMNGFLCINFSIQTKKYLCLYENYKVTESKR